MGVGECESVSGSERVGVRVKVSVRVRVGGPV